MQKDTEEALAECAYTRGRNEALSADIICGGFPCQDISNAGNCAGISGNRSGLWKYLCEAIRVVRPKYAIVENVAALLKRGLSVVLGDLASIGYDAEWHCIPASHVGAEHDRDRVWIIANPDGEWELQPEGREQEERGRTGDRLKKDDADSDETRCSGRTQARENQKDVGEIQERLRSAIDSLDNVSREYWNYKPVLGRGVHGVPDRLDRIGALGNSVVPKIPEIIGRTIMQIENC